MLKRLLFALALASAHLSFAPAQAAQAWRTTHFEIFFGSPHPLKDTAYRGYLAVGADPDTEQTVCREGYEYICDRAKIYLESFLHDYAVALQNDGFADPTANIIDSVIEDENGREVVRVYLYDLGPGAPLGAFTGPCDPSVDSFGRDVSQDKRRVLVLHKLGTFSGQHVSPEGLQNAAHELFHAVQFASTFRQGEESCEVAKWITEGTADAVGFDYVRRLRNLEFNNLYKMRGNDPLFNKPFGLREYHKILSREWPRSSDDYRSSSFWRHLAERYHMKNQDHPGSRKTPTDYRYLAKLFARPYSGRAELNDLRWIDSFMRSQAEFSSGLAPHFSQFMATIADFMETRIPSIAGLSDGERESRWLEWLFEPCAEVNLTAEKPNDKARLRIDSVAARCVAVELGIKGSAPLEIVIENSDLDVDYQKQIRIGASGGEVVQVADIRIAQLPAVDAGQNYAKWHFVAMPGIRNIFIVANVAAKPLDTKIANGEFHFSVPSWKSSLTAQEEDLPSSPEQGQPKSRKAVRDYQRAKRTSPTTKSLAAAVVGTDRNPPDPGCTLDLRNRNLCGPQLSISLTKDFGMMPADAPAASVGGLLKQAGEVNASSTDILVEERMMATKIEQVARQQGNVVSLSIPAVNYGWNGDVSNARVSVSGRNGNALVAVQTVPDADGLRPPTGAVSIIEYTPHILRGYFSADLVTNESLKRATRQNPRVPIANSIQGEFVVAAPWRGSAAAPDVGPDSAMLMGMREDMADFLLKIPEDMRSSTIGAARAQDLCKLGFETEQLASLGINAACGASGAGLAMSIPQCDCDCDAWPIEYDIPLCQGQCSPNWESLQCEAQAEAAVGGRDEETDRYVAELSALGVEGSNYDIQSQAFAAAGPERRTRMWADLDVLREVLAEQGAADLQQAKAQEKARSTPDYDAETLRYKLALEEAGQPPEIVDGMVTVFAISTPQVRQVFWDDLNNQKP
jgi:hypothetical protein